MVSLMPEGEVAREAGLRTLALPDMSGGLRMLAALEDGVEFDC